MKDFLGWCAINLAAVMGIIVAAGVINLLSAIARRAGLHGDVMAGTMLVISIGGVACGILVLVGMMVAVNKVWN